MHIRNYHPEDDSALMALERLCPRGLPEPFIHYRRRFIDRAALFSDHLLLVAEEGQRIVGTVAVGVKRTHIGGTPVSLGYIFDLRTHPQYRRLGIGQALVEAVDYYLIEREIDGVYGDIVAPNISSLRLFEKLGYERVRQLMMLEYYPFPAYEFPEWMPRQSNQPTADQDIVQAIYSGRDLYVPDVAERVQDFGFQRWTVDLGDTHFAGMSLFDQGYVFQQWPADQPFPDGNNEHYRAKSLRLFDEIGAHNPALMRGIFDHLRDIAVADNVSKFTLLLDRMDRVPSFLFAEAYRQLDYWLVFKSLNPDWLPEWQDAPIYVDTRDL